MTRWIAAALCVGAAGLFGAFTLHNAQAQDGRDYFRPRVEARPEPRPRMAELHAEEGDGLFLEVLQDGAPAGPMQWQMAPMQGRGQPGTWQVVTSRDMTLLLNTACGETFRLAGERDALHWVPIERPMARMEGPALPPFPGMPPRQDADQMRKALEELRKHAEKSEERDRDALKEKISEMEKALKNAERQGRPDQPRQPMNEVAEMEALLRRAKDKISDLEGRVEKTDSKRETEELKRQLEDLRADAKKLAGELEKARKEQKERDKQKDKDRDEG